MQYVNVFRMTVHVVQVVALLLLAAHTSQAGFNQKQCTQACLAISSSNVRREICEMCSEDPPVGLQMCAVACRYPEHPYLFKIAEACTKTVELTDRMCIVACVNYATYPHFKEICTRCRHDPPITGNMCIFACDHGVILSTVCAACAQKPPKDKRLCDYACKKSYLPTGAYHKKVICNDCKYRRFLERDSESKYIFRKLE